MTLLEFSDLTPFAPTIDETKAAAMIEDAVASATIVAPCLSSNQLTDVQVAAARAILRAAVLRWNDTGSGAVSSQTAGPYAMVVDTRQTRRTMFWPSEITALQRICRTGTEGGAFSVDTAAQPMLFHATFCGWSGGWCTCGAIAFDSDWPC